MPDDTLSIRDDAAERALLGSMLRRNEAIAEVAGIVQAGDYAARAHQFCHECIMRLGGKGQPVDAVMLAGELERRGWLEDAGGRDAVFLLESLGSTGHNAAHYAATVRDKAMLRMLHDAAQRIAHMALRPSGSPAETLDESERMLHGLRDRRESGRLSHVRDVAARWGDAYDAKAVAARSGRPLAVRPAVPGLESLVPGFFGGELVIVGGRPGQGKTAVGLAMARGAMEQGRAVLFASLEMADVQLFERLVAAESGAVASRLRTASATTDEFMAAMDARDALAELPLWIDDGGRQGIAHVERQARRISRREPLGLVVVDYAGLVAPDDRRLPRHEQVSQVSRDCKLMAKELALPVLLLSQVRREAEDGAGRRPRLSDLRDSGSLEQDADTVILLHRPDEQSDLMELIVAKQRSGATGFVTAHFRRDRMRFDAVQQPKGVFG